MSFFSLLVLAISVLLAMSIHELAHGLVSYWLGDPTAKLEGRLSLNPFRHVDWVGLLCLMFFGFGWAKPVPIDSRYYKDAKTGIIWTSFAGPVANFLLSLICVFLWYVFLKWMPGFFVGASGGLLRAILQTTASLSLGFGLFNLLPIPPLDGSKILFSFLPDSIYYRFVEGNVWMSLVLIALIYTEILSGPMVELRQTILSFMETICMFVL